MSKKKKRNLILLLSGLVILVGAACYTVFIAPLLEEEEWIYKESTVESGTLTVGVTESGSLEYGVTSITYDLDLSVAVDDDDDDDDDDDEETTTRYLTIDEVYAAAGQRISQGDALMSFTEDSITAVRKLLQNALVEARADYNEAEAEYQLAVLEAETDYQIALVSASYADSIYSYSTKALTDEIQSLQVQIRLYQNKTESLEEAVTEAEEDYAEALADYNEKKAAYEAYGDPEGNQENYRVFQNLYTSALNTYQQAQTALLNAKTAVSDNATKILDLQSKLSTAQAQLKVNTLSEEETYEETTLSGTNAEITYNATLESLKEDLEDAAEDLQEIQDQLDAFEAFVGSDGILYAAGSGIVTESPYSAGDELTTNGTLIAYAAPGDMTITVDVEQEDIVTLTVGDQVEIEFTAYEGEIYSGTILSIDTTATSEDSDTVSYNVVIGVQGDTTALYGGMVADVTFVTEEKENVLYVSRNAIVTEGSRTYVYHLNSAGKMELTEVTCGISNGTHIEITSGLTEGETVYIASRVSSESEVTSEEVTEESDEDTSDTTAENSSDTESPQGMQDFGGGNMPGEGGGQMPGAPGGGF